MLNNNIGSKKNGSSNSSSNPPFHLPTSTDDNVVTAAAAAAALFLSLSVCFPIRFLFCSSWLNDNLWHTHLALAFFRHLRIFFGLFYLMCRCHDQYQDKGISNMNIMNTIHLQSTQQSSYQSIATKYGMRVRKTKIHSTDEKNVIALGSTIWLKLQNKQKQQKIFA